VFLKLDETRLLLNTAKLPRDVALFWCLSYGTRIAEVTALQIGDVTAPNGSGMGSLLVRGKGNNTRRLPICSVAHSAISSYVSGHPDGAVFRVLDGSRPMSTRAIQARFKKLEGSGN
jgi:site-specific recombinase XerC